LEGLTKTLNFIDKNILCKPMNAMEGMGFEPMTTCV
jgi:hypothetical protein